MGKKEYMKEWYKENKERYQKYTKKQHAQGYYEELYQKRHALVDEIKQEQGCQRCGITDPRVLVFHHVDPLEKGKPISKMLTGSIDKLQAEIDKCMVLCSNCHIILHWEERNEKV